jgi:hypothetical protein
MGALVVARKGWKSPGQILRMEEKIDDIYDGNIMEI